MTCSIRNTSLQNNLQIPTRISCPSSPLLFSWVERIWLLTDELVSLHESWRMFRGVLRKNWEKLERSKSGIGHVLNCIVFRMLIVWMLLGLLVERKILFSQTRVLMGSCFCRNYAVCCLQHCHKQASRVFDFSFGCNTHNIISNR